MRSALLRGGLASGWPARGVTALASLLLAAAVSLPALAESPVTDERLANADSEPQNWLTTNQNYASQRYSRLDEITPANVKNLKVAFTIGLSSVFDGRRGSVIDTSPLVDEGMMYFEDGAGMFYKFDVSAGDSAKLVWSSDALMSKDVPGQTRGFALIDNMVVKCLRDGRVVALDRDSGDIVWDVQRMGVEHPQGAGINIEKEGCTAGTVAMGDKVIIANGQGDGGTRGFLEALDPKTGDSLWRWYAVPAPGEPGGETWKDDHNAWKTGGGGLWTTGSYDPGSKQIYWGTANPVPMFDPEYRPGDNLYTNSLVNIDSGTGEMNWYHQYVPNDSWDYDESGVHMLLGEEVVHFARNGYFVAFDKANGQFLKSGQYVDKITWTAGLDPKTGMPVEYNPSMDLQEYIPGTRWLRGEGLASNETVCPNLVGGVRWQYPALNPDAKIAYAVGNDGCFRTEVIETQPLSPEGGIDQKNGGGLFGFNGNFAATFTDPTRGEEVHGAMWAVDVETGKMLAKYERPFVYESGITATAGGVVFTSTIDGLIMAHDAKTLEPLWQFDMGIPSRGTPISYSVGGKQYIAVIASANPPKGGFQGSTREMNSGAAVFVFAL